MEIEFFADKGSLYDFRVLGKINEGIEEVRIPSMARGDQKVKSIPGEFGKTFWKWLYKKGVKKVKRLVIEDGIEKIGEGAFSEIQIRIETVYWPKTCKVIPGYCFYASCIESLIGVEEVEVIGESAFEGSNLLKFAWPPKCKEIPHWCFRGSNLTQITNIEKVTHVGWAAFATTIELRNINWPESCEEIPACCFQLSGLQELTWVRNGPIKIYACAFNRTAAEIKIVGGIVDFDIEILINNSDIKKIDLTNCSAVNLLNATNSSTNELKGKLLLPYYATEIN